MDIIFKEYSRVVWQKKWFFLLALIALSSAMTLDLSAPLYYKKNSKRTGLALFRCNSGFIAGESETDWIHLFGYLAVMAVAGNIDCSSGWWRRKFT
jgi:hypothetical protein